MSSLQSKSWLNSAIENFDEALSEANMRLARDIVSDVLSEGYKDEALALSKKINEVELSENNI